MLSSNEARSPRGQACSASRSVAALFLFGTSFGYVEAALVVYMRALYEPLQQRFHAEYRSGELFPLVTLDQLEEAGPQAMRWLKIELGRELATLLMMAAAALAVARNFRQWLAGFVIAFGVWDLFYYVFLKLFLDWPASLLDWDLLFLLPVPWAGPVLAPIIVALAMVVCGAALLFQEGTNRPICPSRWDWTLIVSGGLLIVAAFCWDFRNLLAGGEPNPFNWPLFLCGDTAGLAGFVHASWK